MISLSQLKIDVKKFNVNSMKEYREKRQENWPSSPNIYYKDEWVSWNDLFGKEKVEFISISQLKIEIEKCKINSQREYDQNRKTNWPSNPDVYYKDEWVSWNDLFGKKKVEFISLPELKEEIKKYNVKNFREYKKNRRNNWPSAPNVYYKDEWVSWNDLFEKEKELISLSQLKIDVKKFNVNSMKEYHEKRQENWPSAPNVYYKDEWVSWNDLFGKEKVEFISLSQLKIDVKKFNVNSMKEYRDKRQENWPSAPNVYYKDEWVSWNDLFGKTLVAA